MAIPSHPPVAQEPYPAPAPARPEVRARPSEWARLNLFNGPVNTALSVVFGLLALWVVYRSAKFVFVSVDWEIVRRNLLTFMVGRFPRGELWRPWAALTILAMVVGLTTGAAASIAAEQAEAAGRDDETVPSAASSLRRFWPLVLLGVALLGFTRSLQPTLLLLTAVVVLVAARWAGARLPRGVRSRVWLVALVGLFVAYQTVVGFGGVGWDDWGGLMLTAFAAVFGIVVAFPLGLALALGRRSTLPAVRVFSIVYIEFIRGVPLISLLLMGQFMIGFFVPPDVDPPSTLARALIAIVLFEAAYIAEIVRGGLQSVPRGQYEAAQAVGLSPFRMTRLIVLPQALRAVIPAMVGQFISLFKDTSLLAIIGFFELLDVALTVTTQPDFLGQGLHAATLAFAGFIYWVGSYTMSRESQRIERRLGVGER